MYQFILLIHVFAAVLLIALVLVQQGKGATVGAAFGSGASQTVFGSRGSGSFLFRVTFGLASVFFITSIALNYVVTSSYKQDKQAVLPVVPEKPAAPANSLQEQIPVPAKIDLPLNNNKLTPVLPQIPKRKST